MPENRRQLGSDLARVDAHVIQPHEYHELPELTDAQLARGIERRGGIAVDSKAPNDAAKSEVTLLLDDDLIAHFKAMGADWPNHVNTLLRNAASLKARG